MFIVKFFNNDKSQVLGIKTFESQVDMEAFDRSKNKREGIEGNPRWAMVSTTLRPTIESIAKPYQSWDGRWYEFL